LAAAAACKVPVAQHESATNATKNNLLTNPPSRRGKWAVTVAHWAASASAIHQAPRGRILPAYLEPTDGATTPELPHWSCRSGHYACLSLSPGELAHDS
jgi:hypothetical protein